MKRIRIGAAAGWMAIAGLAEPALADAPRATSDVMETQCKALANADFSGVSDAPTQVTSVNLAEATAGSAGYCKVEGYISPQVGFELRLPLKTWNGKFMEVGCGGWCGSISGSACDGPLRRGYACIASDMGHKGTAMDVLWAQNNLQALIDFGYRATHVAAVSGKAIAERFYARPPNRSYFMGCSTGGYQGVTAAQKFPWDFDGIIAGAPDIDGAAASLRVMWIVRTYLDDSGKPRLSQKDLQLVHDAALKRCDKDDGVEDGIIGHPLACDFDPQELSCGGGKAGTCLTSSQIDTVKKLYAGPMTSAGEKTSTRGYLPGSELMWSQFWPASSLEQFFRYAIPGYSTGPQWKSADFDFNDDHKRFGLAAYYENTNPDLRKFKQAGGKLLVYHGGDDTINLPGPVTDYYETVERTMGGRGATQDFFRLFMVPGMNHCSGGKGAFSVDWLSVLEAWVEQGRAPDVVTSAHVSEKYLATARLPDLPATLPAETTPEMRASIAAYYLRFPLDPAIPLSFSRPIYPFPLFARYRGRGDPSNAMSFGPVKP